MNVLKTFGKTVAISTLAIGAMGSAEAGVQTTLQGQVSVMGRPIRGSSITLWQTRGGQEPKPLRTVSSSTSGGFTVQLRPERGVVHYLVARSTDDAHGARGK
jgi:hypothetical protein